MLDSWQLESKFLKYTCNLGTVLLFALFLLFTFDRSLRQNSRNQILVQREKSINK